ncbi:hypothetical protein CDAR_556421 [Caerostris darwini]|uniref:Uncharacterized protein n=1 Tax=Caerostris darwini TaxID=1538125 RepID=A0AAV4SSK0_9ARAC|nr:hypothetical protein CDAR_556421 [Caerostris darwini]
MSSLNHTKQFVSLPRLEVFGRVTDCGLRNKQDILLPESHWGPYLQGTIHSRFDKLHVTRFSDRANAISATLNSDCPKLGNYEARP